MQVQDLRVAVLCFEEHVFGRLIVKEMLRVGIVPRVVIQVHVHVLLLPLRVCCLCVLLLAAIIYVLAHSLPHYQVLNHAMHGCIVLQDMCLHRCR